MTPWGGTYFYIAGRVWDESTSPVSQKYSSAEFWCFLICYPNQALKQTAELPVIWDAMTLTRRHWTVSYQIAGVLRISKYPR